MKYSFLMISTMMLLGGCMGAYTQAKCVGRETDLKDLAGKYRVPSIEMQVLITRTDVGRYTMTQSGELLAELVTCKIGNEEFAEVTIDGITTALRRDKKRLTVISFDTQVLAAAGVSYERREDSEYFDGEFVVVTAPLNDKTFVDAVVLGDLQFVKL